ncbi:MAG: STAS domain-containing protein [Pseudomonadales bacterium]
MSDAGFDFRLEGSVTFANLLALRGAGEAAIAAAGDRVRVDLSPLEAGNSLAVALLMTWFRTAEHAGKSVSFAGAPDDLERIIGLYGVDDVLPLAAADRRPQEAVK